MLNFWYFSMFFTAVKIFQISFSSNIIAPDEYSTELMSNISDGQDFILDSWHVPMAWVNPCISRDPSAEDRIIMIWRMLDSKKRDKVGYMWLSSNFTVSKNPDMIEVFGEDGINSRYNLIAEDARIFEFDKKLFLIYNVHLTKFKEVYLGHLLYDTPNDAFYVNITPRHISIEHEVGAKHQKNWTPFVFNSSIMQNVSASQHQLQLHWESRSVIDVHSDTVMNSSELQLFFVYSIRPHRIIRFLPTADYSKMTAHTVFLTAIMAVDDDWAWGEMRGGTPALQVDDDHYLSFFHSSGFYNMKFITTYCMGAYLFSTKPPFAITHMSKEPIVAKPFINESLNGWAYKAVDSVVFPMGFVMDEGHIYVSCGRNDRESWMVKLNRTGLLESLKPVRHIVMGASHWYPNGTIIPHSFKHDHHAYMQNQSHLKNGDPAASSAKGLNRSEPLVSQLFPQGTVIREEHSKAFYYVENDMKRWIPNWDTFVALKLDVSKVTVVDEHTFGRLPEGIAMPVIERRKRQLRKKRHRV